MRVPKAPAFDTDSGRIWPVCAPKFMQSTCCANIGIFVAWEYVKMSAGLTAAAIRFLEKRFPCLYIELNRSCRIPFRRFLDSLRLMEFEAHYLNLHEAYM